MAPKRLLIALFTTFIIFTAVQSRNIIQSEFVFGSNEDISDGDLLDFDLSDDNYINYKDEPDYNEYAKVARYVVHKSKWGSMGTISTIKAIQGFPMVNIISIADSAKDAPSTGHIYFLLTKLDYTAIDLAKDNRLTVLFSNDQDLACQMRNIDPMEPTCARIMISGKAIRLENGTTEYDTGMSAYISNHPAAKNWVKQDGHNFFLCELDISQIAVLDYYGGPHYVDVDEYYKVELDNEDHGILPTEMIYFNSLNTTDMVNSKKILIQIKRGDEIINIDI